MSVTYAPHTFATAPVVHEGRRLDTAERATVSKSLRTSERVAFALVSLSIFAVVAVVSLPVAGMVAIPLLAAAGIALSVSQDERIAHEIDLIELELATID